jgi:hypothetical protein
MDLLDPVHMVTVHDFLNKPPVDGLVLLDGY